MKAESVDREFRVEPLGKEHDRAAFSCGVESLDRYLRTQASQDMRRKANAVLVLVRSDVPAAIVGYFTLCATTLSQNAVPEEARKQLPLSPGQCNADRPAGGRSSPPGPRHRRRVARPCVAQGVRKCLHHRLLHGRCGRDRRASGPILRSSRLHTPSGLDAAHHPAANDRQYHRGWTRSTLTSAPAPPETPDFARAPYTNGERQTGSELYRALGCTDAERQQAYRALFSRAARSGAADATSLRGWALPMAV